MRAIVCVAPVVLAGFTACSTMALTSTWSIDDANIVPDTVANALTVDGAGDDWTAAVLKVDLTSGSVYNEPTFGATGIDGLGDRVQANLWGFVPALQWDSAVGIAHDDTTATILTGSAELGGSPHNLGGTGDNAVSMGWFNIRNTDTGPVQIANITLTDDASGEWEMLVAFADNPAIQLGGTVQGGVLVPEPACVALMSMCSLAIMRRRC